MSSGIVHETYGRVRFPRVVSGTSHTSSSPVLTDCPGIHALIFSTSSAQSSDIIEINGVLAALLRDGSRSMSISNRQHASREMPSQQLIYTRSANSQRERLWNRIAQGFYNGMLTHDSMLKFHHVLFRLLHAHAGYWGAAG